jgi:hypothetical protein
MISGSSHNGDYNDQGLLGSDGVGLVQMYRRFRGSGCLRPEVG